MPDFLKGFNAVKAKIEAGMNSSSHSQFPGQQNVLYQSMSAPSTPYWTANFNTDQPVTSEWRRETGAHGWGNAELEDYTDSDRNSFFRQSTLVLKAIVEGNSLTSARLTSHEKLGRDRGYLEASIVAPSAKGIWPAFWLLPSEPFSWPSDGEIDVMESWNAEMVNHACLHWGQYNGEDHDKHRVIDTQNHPPNSPQGHVYGLCWDQATGRLLWYIDGRAIMKADIPGGMRQLADFQVKFNIAMGGNVMQGVRPGEGNYEMVVHHVILCEEPPGGWQGSERDWQSAPFGHGY